MARRSSGALIPGLTLDREAAEPLSRQLFRGIRERVISGQLEPGARMPASRSFANDLGVSRTTVAQAYDQLKSEGYLSGQEKSGTFVPQVLPDARAWRQPRAEASDAAADEGLDELAERMQGTSPSRPERGAMALPFHPGIPAIAAFPALLYARVQRQVSLELIRSGAARCPAEGATALREQIAFYLGASRGVVCEPSQVFIISGTHQALHLVLMGLSTPVTGPGPRTPAIPARARPSR